jgi:hypothetical protein
VVEKDGGLDFLLEANLEHSPAKEDLQMQNDDDFNKLLQSEDKAESKQREGIHRQRDDVSDELDVEIEELAT